MTALWVEPKVEDSMVLEGDSHRVLKKLVEWGVQVDSVVSGPPYGVGTYDLGMPQREVWEMLLKVIKPGGYMLVSGNPKTNHRQMCDIEDAGWVIKDQLIWLFNHGYVDKIGSAAWAVHKETLGRRASIQRGFYVDEAQKWKGWGKTLRPAWEPIVLAQRENTGDVGKDLIQQGVGALNFKDTEQLRLFDEFGDNGKPPKNVIMDLDVVEEVADLFGQTKFKMFFCTAVSEKERQLGVGLDKGNDHETVYPIALMRWMIQLITPPGGVVLDPYCGSGSTGAAAMLENCKFLGIDIEPRYVEIARERIEYWRKEAEKKKREGIEVIAPQIITKVKILKRGSVGIRGVTSMREGSTCRKGHRLTEKTIYTRPDGRQECKLCKRDRRKGI